MSRRASLLGRQIALTFVSTLTLAACLLLGPLTASAQTTASPTVTVDLASQPLADAIGALSRLSGVRIIVSDALVASRTAPAVKGTLTLRDALEHLLAGTGLIVFDDGQSLTIRRDGDAIELAPVVVDVLGSAPSRTTESTHSYTTPAMSTATGLDLSIRDTPQAVSVLTRERLNDQSITTITDATRNVTGLSTRPYDSARQTYAARGFEITNTLIDGIPTTHDPAWASGENEKDMAIYDRVEIVRGSTGLTAGPGNPSAAINLSRKMATSRDVAGDAAFRAGSWNSYRADLDVSAPLVTSGRVRGRFVGAFQSRESFIDLEERDTSLLYGVVNADLTARTELATGISWQDNDPRGSMWGGLPIWYADGSRTDWDVSKTSAASWSTWASINTNVFAQITHRLKSGWQFRGSYSLGDYDADEALLFLSGGPDRVTGLGMSAYPVRYGSSRVQHDIGVYGNGPFRLFAKRHELSFGAIDSRQTFTSTVNYALDIPEVGDFNRWDGSYPQPAWRDTEPWQDDNRHETAAFIVTRLTVAQPVKVIVGSRVSRLTLDGAYYQGGTSYDIPHTAATPYAGVVWTIDRSHSLYGSYADIYRPQFERDRGGRYLDPIRGNTYEGGVKGEYFGGKLNAAAAVFRILQDNAAQLDGGAVVDGTVDELAYVAANGATSVGYELELSGELGPGWQTSVGWSQFRARDRDRLDINTNMPRKLLKLFTRYAFRDRLHGLTIGGGVNTDSLHYMVVQNLSGAMERVEQPAYTLVSLMARYDVTPRVSVQVNSDNVTNTKYYGQIGFYSQLAYGSPRSVDVTVRYAFK